MVIIAAVLIALPLFVLAYSSYEAQTLLLSMREHLFNLARHVETLAARPAPDDSELRTDLRALVRHVDELEEDVRHRFKVLNGRQSRARRAAGAAAEDEPEDAELPADPRQLFAFAEENGRIPSPPVPAASDGAAPQPRGRMRPPRQR